jgi:Lrp/AsnC family transcriptional regulator, leucine-responsive regulatory protein
LDVIDLTLLDLVQRNGRVSQHDLARAVGLSAPAVAERLRKLEERGVIRGYTAILDPERLGRGLASFIFVGVSGSRHFAAFRARVEEEPSIVECSSVTGEASHILKVRVASTRALEALLAEIQGWPGVQWTRTSVVMSALKEETAVPLPEEMDEGSQGAGGASQLLHVPFRHHT